MRPLEAARALQGVFSAPLVLVSFLLAWVAYALEVVVRRPSLVAGALSSSLVEGLGEGVLASLAEVVVVRHPSLVEEVVVLTSRP